MMRVKQWAWNALCRLFTWLVAVYVLLMVGVLLTLTAKGAYGVLVHMGVMGT